VLHQSAEKRASGKGRGSSQRKTRGSARDPRSDGAAPVQPDPRNRLFRTASQAGDPLAIANQAVQNLDNAARKAGRAGRTVPTQGMTGCSNPTRPCCTGADLEHVVGELAAAGAFATVEIKDYSLGLGGSGIVELLHGCTELIGLLVAGAPAEHAWVFGSFGTELPVITFALQRDWVTIATRAHAEEAGAPLVVLAGRDLPQPVRVPSQLVLGQCRGVCRESPADVDRILPGAGDARGHRAAAALR
jgi:hypothetical protein